VCERERESKCLAGENGRLDMDETLLSLL